MFSALIVHARPEPGLALTLSRLVEAALAGLLADVALLDLCDDPLAARLADDGGCALRRPRGDPTAALAQAVAAARAEWLLIAASGLAPVSGWALSARETLALAAAQGDREGALAGAFFTVARRGPLARLRAPDGVVLARRDVLAAAPPPPLDVGRAAFRAARRAGRVRRLEGMCDDERG
jgi:hypothetical protein